MIPKIIYLQIGDEVDLSFVDFKDLHKDAITWCEDKINVNDIEYINKEYSDQQNKALLDEIEMLKFQLKAADSVNEWISVEDRLPLDYVPYSYTETNYLIYIELPTGFRIEMAEWFTSDCEELKSYFIPIKSHYGYDYKITHWMPLPNQPK